MKHNILIPLIATILFGNIGLTGCSNNDADDKSNTPRRDTASSSDILTATDNILATDSGSDVIDTLSGTDTSIDTDSQTDTNTAIDSETSTWSDWPFGDYTKSTDSSFDTASDTNFEVCEKVSTELNRIQPRMVILLDKSGSMSGTMWTTAVSAVNTIVTTYDDDISFGMDVFPSNTSSDVASKILLDVAPGNSETILSSLDTLSASGGTPLYIAMKQYAIEYTYSITAVDTDTTTDSDTDTATDNPDTDKCPHVCSTGCNALGGAVVTGTCTGIAEKCCELDAIYMTDTDRGMTTLIPRVHPDNQIPQSYAPVFLDGAGPSYLVVITDGFAEKIVTPPDSPKIYSSPNIIQSLGELTAILFKHKNIKTIAVGFGSGASPTELNAIASNGGTHFSQYINADDGTALSNALRSIAETVAVSCDFEVGTFDKDEVDYDKVVLSFDGTTVPRNANDCESGVGWSWRDDTKTAIKLCEQACNTLQTQDIQNVDIELACNADDVIVVE